MKKITLFSFIAIITIAIFIYSCKKDEFTEEDALQGQQDLLTHQDSLDRLNQLLRDSLNRIGGIIHYTVNVVDAGDAGFAKSTSSTLQMISGAIVTASQNGLIITDTSNTNGMVVFEDMRIGNIAVSVQVTGYTDVNFVADLTPATDPTGESLENIVRYAATQIPVFPLTGTSLATINGQVTYESNLTNLGREPVAGVDVSTCIDVGSANFMDTFLPSGGSLNEDQAGRILTITFSDAVSRTTTDATGLYSLQVPSTANGLPTKLHVSDVAVDQTLLMNTMYQQPVTGPQTIRTIFSSEQVAPADVSNIPTVPPVYVTFGAPTGTPGSDPTVTATATAAISQSGTVEAIYVTNAGNGYTQPPVVNIISTSGTGASATANITADGKVSSITVDNPGQGYTAAPTITLVDGGKDGSALASLSYSVINITMDDDPAPPFDPLTGYDYTQAGPTIEIISDDGVTTTATAQPNMFAYVKDVIVTNPGSGYTTVPQVVITGGGGSGATATVDLTTGPISAIIVPQNADVWFTASPEVDIDTLDIEPGSDVTATANLKPTGRVESLTFISAGLGYTYADVVVNGDGSGAVATATILALGSINVQLVEGGSGYTWADVIISGDGGGADYDCVISFQIGSVTITNGGYGYDDSTTGDDVTFDGSPIPGTEVQLNRSITQVNVPFNTGFYSSFNGTGYTSPPTVTFIGGGGSGATGYAELGWYVASVTVINQGSGYTSAPTINFTGGGGSGAFASATLGNGVISEVNLTNPGSGYTAPPNVILSLGGGSAINLGNITATVAAGEITGLTIDNAGQGYTFPSSANIAISTSINTATAAANLTSAQVVAVNVTNPGAGYTVAPIVEFTGGGGTGAAATATITDDKVTLINVTNGGSGYTSAPAVTLVVPNTNQTAKGTVNVSDQGVVTGVTIDDGGDGYVNPPTVTFTPSISGTGSGAAGIAVITGGQISGVTITNGGSGYIGQNTPGDFINAGTPSIPGEPFEVSQGGSNFDVEAGQTFIKDIYLGTGKRNVED